MSGRNPSCFPHCVCMRKPGIFILVIFEENDVLLELISMQTAIFFSSPKNRTALSETYLLQFYLHYNKFDFNKEIDQRVHLDMGHCAKFCNKFMPGFLMQGPSQYYFQSIPTHDVRQTSDLLASLVDLRAAILVLDIVLVLPAQGSVSLM